MRWGVCESNRIMSNHSTVIPRLFQGKIQVPRARGAATNNMFTKNVCNSLQNK